MKETANRTEISSNGTEMEVVPTYEYLRSVITNDGQIEAELSNIGIKSTKI